MRARLALLRLVRVPYAVTENMDSNRWEVMMMLYIIIMLCNIGIGSAAPVPDQGADAEVLMKFRASLIHAKALSNWDPSRNTPCSGNRGNWAGVICFQGKVWGLQLENMGLVGMVDTEALVSLPWLRTLSFMNNTFAGPMPNMKLLSKLKSLYLSYNHFSGVIPEDAFAGMNSLKKLYMANNQFSGKIPPSLLDLPRLLVLRLDGNKLEGPLLDFKQKGLKLNVSNNLLSGPLPTTVSSMDPSSFAGNTGLCGSPLDSCAIPPFIRKKPPVVKILLLVLIVLIILTLFALAWLILLRLKHKTQVSSHINAVAGAHDRDPDPNNKVNAGSVYPMAGEHDNISVSATSISTGGFTRKGTGGDYGKLLFIKEERDNFDLQDLLRASAEILGSNTFGSSYKAVMTDGQSIVVKRYRQMNMVGREEFHEHMRRLGSLKHPHVLPLVAFYYRKEEKLLLTDFVQNGCLASKIHGNHNINHPGLDWPARLKIIKGVARGLSYLYTALPSVTAPHGHLKSSNVLLNESMDAVLTDYALIPVMNHDHAQQLMTVYKSPEFAQTGRISKKTDVWCFGILILEMLTGKFPENHLKQKYDTDTDIVSWVNSMIKEKRTSEMFDVEMRGVRDNKSELLKLLKIGLNCCKEDVDRRLDIHDAVEQIQEVKEGEMESEYCGSPVGEEENA